MNNCYLKRVEPTTDRRNPFEIYFTLPSSWKIRVRSILWPAPRTFLIRKTNGVLPKIIWIVHLFGKKITFCDEKSNFHQQDDRTKMEWGIGGVFSWHLTYVLLTLIIIIITTDYSFRTSQLFVQYSIGLSETERERGQREFHMFTNI